MAAQGFRVDTDKLAAVAKQVQSLLDDISGAGGQVPGNIPDFTKADGHELQDGLAAIWPDWHDGFAKGFGLEHQGMMTAYTSIQQQLTALLNACQNTAGGYSTQETNTRSRFNSTREQI